MGRNRKVVDLDAEIHLNTRVPQRLYDEVADFAERMEAVSMSDALREVITMGLANSKDLEDRFIAQAQDNARRGAIRRMQGIIRAAMNAAIEAFGEEETSYSEEQLDEE